MLYQDLVESYSKEPRDVHTIPLNREPIWFFTYVEKGFVYVRSSYIHSRSSRMKAPRKLNPAEFKIMFELYVRRKNGERVSDDATRSSQNQVYWIGIFRNMEVQKTNDTVSGQFSNGTYDEHRKHSYTLPPPVNKRIDNHCILNVLEYEFQFVQQLIPECENGMIKEYAPQKQYANHEHLPVGPYGSGTFCRFSIRTPVAPGVYLWVVAGEIIYIGETTNLLNRFNNGYGNISPRNCYIGGQSTNCKMNKVVMEYYKKGQVIDLYFLPTEDYKQIELSLLRRIHTKYNVKDN